MRKSLANGNPNSDAEAKSPRRPSLLELYASQDIIVLQIWTSRVLTKTSASHIITFVSRILTLSLKKIITEKAASLITSWKKINK